ncbi:MAG: c-type cytochrome [Candidatus Anammoxibacter sp.]
MNKSFLFVVLFMFIVLGSFVGICNYVTVISGGSGDSGGAEGINAEAGKEIYFGDGQCSTCHKVGGEGSATRCPDHEDLFSTAIERMKETGDSSAMAYLVNSIVNPQAYIVKGFGKIMPKVYDAPILLSKEKILAVLAYLQSLGGEENIDEIMKFADLIPEAGKGKQEKPWVPPIVADAAAGEKLFFDVNGPAGCVKCHTIMNRGNTVCPNLTGIGGVQKPEYFVESVLQPSAVIVNGYETVLLEDTYGIIYTGIIKRDTDDEIDIAVDEGGPEISIITIPKDEIEDMVKQEVSMMPGNFAEILSTKQLYDIVSFLISQKS